MTTVSFRLSFEGGTANEHLINAYDAAKALQGFERSIALTTHAVLNGDIIVKAPALKGASVLIAPPRAGSWVAELTVVIGGIWALNNAARETPIGHLLYSAYDYVIKTATGRDLDYSKSIRKILEDGRNSAPEASDKLSVGTLDAVIERCEKSIGDIHRPIVESRTSDYAHVLCASSRISDFTIDEDTYRYISQSVERPSPESFSGAISSYNINSFTGRVYIPSEGRTVPFVLSDTLRNSRYLDSVTSSLRANALKLGNQAIEFESIVYESSNGRTKRLLIIDL